MLRLGTFSGVATALCIFSAVAFGAGLLEHHSVGATLWVLLSLAASLIVGFYFLRIASQCIIETLRRSPRLVIETTKIKDDRSRVSLSWSSVTSVRPLHGRVGIAALRFEVKGPIAAHYNPFLPGSSLLWRRKPNELHISVVGLDVSPDALASILIELVRHHGGAVLPIGPLW